MNLGQIAIWHAFFASLVAGFLFFRDGRTSDHNGGILSKRKLSVRLFYLMTGAGLVASCILLYHLLSHQFQYTYVAKYSSLAQPTLYLISALWAGQEGTFLLWAVMVSVMGIVFMKKSLQSDPYAMSVVSAFTAFLYLLMLVKSPFETMASVPKDGSGMNPLLQDPWMAIHPPILFLGYAASIFPFALVVSGLARRNYMHWISVGFSWTLFATAALGAGIIIGGFWAYEVLGWGGYWGWDPVENSSLVPWLILLALIHGLLVQKAKGALARTNLFLAIMTFLFVLYATFLTRSGVLSDFSVHSFVDLGINNYLIGIMLASLIVGMGLFVTRFKEIQSPKIGISQINREVMLLCSLFVLGAAALFTFVGMSSPILTGFFGKASQVDPSFYNKVNLPVAIAMALLLSVSPFLGWAEDKKTGFVRRLTLPFLLTALASVIAYVAGVNTPLLMLFFASSAFALISNTIVLLRQYRSGWVNLGGPLAHIGVGLLLIGIIGSGKFDQTAQVVLKANEPQQVNGFQFTFRGMEEMEDQKQQVKIEVSGGNSTYLATPKLYYSELNQAIMREPDIKVYPLTDLYISPIELRTAHDGHPPHDMHELSKGESKEINGYQITFARFEMGSHGQPGAMAVGAVLNVSSHGQQHEVVPQLLFNERGEREMIPAELPMTPAGGHDHDRPHVSLNAISVEQKKVLLEVHGFEETEAVLEAPELIVEISTKPLMMVLWTGVVLIIAGTLVAFRRRASFNS